MEQPSILSIESITNWLNSKNNGQLANLFKYFFCGGVAAVFDISFFAIFAKYFGLNYIVVSLIGFIFATYINYYLSIKIVFQSKVRFKKDKEVLMIYLVSGVGQIIHIFLLYLLIGKFRTDKMMAKLIATFTVFIWNYLSRKMYVFAKKDILINS